MCIRDRGDLKSTKGILEHARSEPVEAVTALEQYIAQIDWEQIAEKKSIDCTYLNKSIAYATGPEPKKESSASYKDLVGDIYKVSRSPIGELVWYIRIATHLYSECRDNNGTYREVFVAKQRMIALMSLYGHVMNEWLEEFDSSCGILRIESDGNGGEQIFQIAQEDLPSNDNLSSFLLGVSNSHLNEIEKRILGRSVVGSAIPGIYVDATQRRIVVHADQKYRWWVLVFSCLLYTSPSPRDATLSRMPSSA